MVWTPTTEQILDLDGVRRRIDRFRFELCDRELQPIGELHPDRAASTPTIQNDTGNSTSRRLTGFKLLPDEAADVNTITDRVRVYMRLQNGVEYRLGTFLWADASRPLRPWGEEQHSELVDFSYILSQQTTQVWSWGRGATITLIMFFLMFRAGFELQDIAVIGEEASRGLAEPVAWQPGSTWNQMLSDLGGLVGFVGPWVDRDGRVHLDAAPDPAFAPVTIPAYESGTRVVKDSIVYTDDFLGGTNSWAVFDSGTDRFMLGRYQLPSSAPHSFQNRGYNIGQSESVQGIETQAQADMAARNLARGSDAFEWLNFKSTLDPRHDTYDVIRAFGQTWLETAWAMELRSGGLMDHTAKRVTYDVT